MEIYTDGSCEGNPGPGGWGVVVVFEDKIIAKLSGRSEGDTTNNRMELLAAIKALKHFTPETREVSIWSDSRYVIDGITKWIIKWKAQNWMLDSTRPVKNKDLWERLDALTEGVSINWKWVKGHGKNRYNNMADLLATGMLK